MNKELISCMPDGVKTTYEGFLRKVKKAGKMQTSCSSGPAEGGGGEGAGRLSPERDTFVSGILKGRSYWTS